MKGMVTVFKDGSKTIPRASKKKTHLLVRNAN
jgi:hypothetical protein